MHAHDDATDADDDDVDANTSSAEEEEGLRLRFRAFPGANITAGASSLVARPRPPPGAPRAKLGAQNPGLLAASPE